MEEIQQTPTNIDGGDKQAAVSPIDEASSILKRMEEANKERRELLDREEKLHARILLSGRGQAGIPTKTPEEIEKENIDAEVKKSLTKYGFTK